MAQMKHIHFTLNGVERDAYIDVRASLTDMIRNDYREEHPHAGKSAGSRRRAFGYSAGLCG